MENAEKNDNLESLKKDVKIFEIQDSPKKEELAIEFYPVVKNESELKLS